LYFLLDLLVDALLPKGTFVPWYDRHLGLHGIRKNWCQKLWAFFSPWRQLPLSSGTRRNPRIVRTARKTCELT
jgi:hypothetical protein